MRDPRHHSHRQKHESDGEKKDRTQVTAKIPPRSEKRGRIKQWRKKEKENEVGIETNDGEKRNEAQGQADKHEQETSPKRDELQKQHDAEKDKPEEQTKSALKTMKDQYGKLHEAGQKLQGPLKAAVEKSDTAIGKSAQIAMSQARGAVDQVQAAYADAQ